MVPKGPSGLTVRSTFQIKGRLGALFGALFRVGHAPTGVFPQPVLLRHEHLDKSRAVAVFLQSLEHRFLSLGHRTADAMPLPFELAHVDAGAWSIGHGGRPQRDKAGHPRPAFFIWGSFDLLEDSLWVIQGV